MGLRDKAVKVLKFVCFSLGAGVVEFGSFALLTRLLPNTDRYIVVAEVISVALSCLFNFTLNRKYTFKSASNIYLGMALYGLFYLVMTPLGAWFILKLMGWGLPELVAKIVKMVVNFAFDFLFCNFVLFRSPSRPQTREG